MDNLKVGIIGLGRMGKRYAEIIQYRIKNATLIAASSLDDQELDYAQNTLGIRQVYSNYKDLLALNELDAVFVLSSTHEHVRHILEALEIGLHVFCEKPLALNVDDCKKVEAMAARRPNLHTVVGFVRRFDHSYQYAKAKVESGDIGVPIMLKSQTVDLASDDPGQVEYSKKNGGIFLDFNVYDIDLARWFLGSEVKSVYSVGDAYKYKKYKEINDADNVMTICKMENGTMAHIIASRTGAHGHDTFTEIVGTEGSLRIGHPASKNRVVIYDKYGARQECVETIYERFEDAFQNQIQTYINSVLRGDKLNLTLDDAVEATRVGVAMTRSFLMNEVVTIERQ